MTSVTSRLRTRLDTLWKAIRDENMVSDQVSEVFLESCKIKLVQHNFWTTEDVCDYQSLYLGQSPPVLFAPLPESTIDDHPFDYARCQDPSTGGSVLDFINYGFRDYALDHLQSTRHHPRYLSGYLKDWTFPGFPRKHLPPLVWSLADLSYLVPIRLSREIYYSRPGIFGEKLDNLWSASMWEYWKDNDRTYHPHIVMLSDQLASGRDGEILYGELIQLITAMRNRAHQHVMIENYDDNECEEPELRQPPEYYFKYEQRFPVLMVSCVAPQHARIYYACMDGSDVIIRQSPLFDFQIGQKAPFDYFARVLASRRLEENEEIRTEDETSE